MYNYKKLIKDNEQEFDNPEQLTEFLDAYMQDGDEVSDHEDNLHEYADSLVPLYYNEIINEWKDNQSCHGEAGEQGLIEGVTDAYKIMQADLYCHYYGELSKDFSTLAGLIDDLPEVDDDGDEFVTSK